jgi:hypothetical protein
MAVQTRIVVESEGALRRLFSVFEDKHDRLLITTHCASSAWNGLDSRYAAALKNMKHTVHNSPQSQDGGLLIHQTQLLQALDSAGQNEKIDIRCYTLAVRDHVFQPIYTRAVRHLGDDQILPANKKGPVWCVGRLDPSRGTLLYGIVLSRADQPPGFQTSDPYEVFSIPFRRYRLHVFVSASRVLPTNFDIYRHALSSTPNIPFGPPVPERAKVPLSGYPLLEMKQWTPWVLCTSLLHHADQAIRAGAPQEIVERLAELGPILLSDLKYPLRRATKTFVPDFSR